MSKNCKSIQVDPNKFTLWYMVTSKKRGIKSATEFAERIGYNPTFVNNVQKRGIMSAPSIKSCELVYGLKLEDILPDEPEAKPEPVKEPEQTTLTPAPAADLSRLEDMVKRIADAVAAVQTVTDDVRKGFRVQTTPRMDTESISEGVCAGISRFWAQNKREIIGQLRGLVYAGTFEAGKQLDEVRKK